MKHECMKKISFILYNPQSVSLGMFPHLVFNCRVVVFWILKSRRPWAALLQSLESSIRHRVPLFCVGTLTVLWPHKLCSRCCQQWVAMQFLLELILVLQDHWCGNILDSTLGCTDHVFSTSWKILSVITLSIVFIEADTSVASNRALTLQINNSIGNICCHIKSPISCNDMLCF